MLQRDVSLKPYNTFGVDAKARLFREIQSERELTEFLMDNAHILPEILVLGGGSNMLLVSDVDGVVLKNGIKGFEVVEEDECSLLLKIGAGETWHDVVMHCLDRNWGGIENLALIPGSVGAAPIQNIGAYGVELEAVFDRLEAVHLSTASVRVFDKVGCQFGYRDSIFKREAKGAYMITRVYLRLTKAPHHVINTHYVTLQRELEQRGISQPGIRDVAEAVIAVRQSKLPNPAEIGNSGSFFKNPVVSASRFAQIKQQHPTVPHYPQEDGRIKLPAGWLIEKSGWKGFREGDFGVHAKQALVLVNYGNAAGADIFRLSSRILEDVKTKFGIELEREVNVIGRLS